MLSLTESQLIWGLALFALCATVLPYTLLFRYRKRKDRERLDEARELGIDKPVSAYPHIDPELCIGCGTCVSVCPEGDVLGMVGGLATVINGVRCIGIALCEQVCPVGAIEVGLGEIKGRADIPVMDDSNETNVPGLFIAGELGGLALISHAVRQGAMTVSRVAHKLQGARRSSDSRVADVVIVGSGPAGLSAALAATEQRLSYVVLERATDLGGTIFNFPRRKVIHIQPVDLPLHGRIRREEQSKEELLELFEGLVRRFKLNIRFNSEVTAVRALDDGFVVQTAAGYYRSRFVILALGRRGKPRRLEVPGEELPKVMYEVREAEMYEGERILIVGGGDSAVEAALGLARQPGNRVHVSYRRDRFARIKKKNQEKIEMAIRKGKIKPIFNSNVKRIDPKRVTLEQEGREITVANDFVFVMIGGEPPFPLLREAGVRFGDDIVQPGGPELPVSSGIARSA